MDPKRQPVRVNHGVFPPYRALRQPYRSSQNRFTSASKEGMRVYTGGNTSAAVSTLIFKSLLDGIVGPEDLRDPSMSLGVIFHELGAALEPKPPTGKRVDDVEFDRGVVPEVLDGAWRREIGEPQFVVAKNGD